MRRPTWITIAAVAVVVILAVAVTAYLAGRNSSPRPTAQGSSSSSATASAQSTASGSAGDVGAAPTGCLGGTARNDAMVLAAQRQAPRTAYGAVEVAAATFRWAIRSPEPSAVEVHRIAPLFMASKRSAAEAQLIADYAANPNPSNGVVAGGQPFYLTTANGQWLVGSGGSSDSVAVSVQAYFVIDGVVSATKSLTETFDLVWQSGAWRLQGLASGDASRLAAGGTQFTAGC